MALLLLAGGDSLAGHSYLQGSDRVDMDDGSSAVEAFMAVFAALVFLMWIPCGVYAGVIAASKNHNWFPWSLGGFVFGPVALIATAGLPDRKLHRYVRLISGDKDEPSEGLSSVTRQKSLNPSDLR